MYTAPLGDIMRHHEVSLHHYDNDTQTYCAFKTSDAGDFDETKLKLEARLFAVLYFSVRSSRSSALRFGRILHECQNYSRGSGRFGKKREK